MSREIALLEEIVGLLRSIDRRLRISAELTILESRSIMSALDDLIAQVHQNTDVEASAVQAINGLATQLAAAVAASAAANDPKLKAITDQLAASSSALAAAIANTNPAAPAPAPVVAPPADPVPAPPTDPAPTT